MPEFNFSQLPVLEDFAIFLTFLKRTEPIVLTNEKAQLKKDDLFRLNEEMHFKTEWITDKSVQYAYPLLDFFYQVVVKSKMARIYHSNKAKKLQPDFEKLALYNAMSTAGQYFFLLETMWRYVNWAKLTEMRGNYFLQFITPGLELISFMEEEKVYDLVDGSLKGLNRKDSIEFVLGRKIYEILWFLGLYELKPQTKLLKKPDKYTFPYAAIKVNKLGINLIPVLLEKRPLEIWNQPLCREVELDKDFLIDFEATLNLPDESAKPNTTGPVTTEQTALSATADEAKFLLPFQSIFELQDIGESFYANVPEFKIGAYLLKIALDPKLYRTVAMGANHTLYDLHEIIQEAFKFENDHLFAFFLDDDLWSPDAAYYDPEAERGYPAHLAKLGNLDLAVGQRFLYVFDFGAQWVFDITVIEIQEDKAEPENPRIIEMVGRAPKQYGKW